MQRQRCVQLHTIGLLVVWGLWKRRQPNRWLKACTGIDIQACAGLVLWQQQPVWLCYPQLWLFLDSTQGVRAIGGTFPDLEPPGGRKLKDPDVCDWETPWSG